MKKYFLFLLFFLLMGCGENKSIVNYIGEHEANEIIVYLASHGIEAQKIKASVAERAGTGPSNLWNITVDTDNELQAMALLNKQGLPRIKGTTLLQLFAKEGLMSSDKEEKIRYQAGVEEELKNIIRKIDGVLDADVQISFSTIEPLPGSAPQPIKAAVYVKHQGVFDNPNNHLETKIKRLVSGSIENLNFDDVAIIADKSLMSTLQIRPKKSEIYTKAHGKEYVKIWSIIMTKASSAKFRMIFFVLIFLLIIFGGTSAWLLYKFFPLMQKNKKK